MSFLRKCYFNGPNEQYIDQWNNAFSSAWPDGCLFVMYAKNFNIGSYPQTFLSSSFKQLEIWYAVGKNLVPILFCWWPFSCGTWYWWLSQLETLLIK